MKLTLLCKIGHKIIRVHKIEGANYRRIIMCSRCDKIFSQFVLPLQVSKTPCSYCGKDAGFLCLNQGVCLESAFIQGRPFNADLEDVLARTKQ